MDDYASRYTPDGFWAKFQTLSGEKICSVLEKAVTLYVLLTSSKAKAVQRTAITTALGYWVFPFDAVPDVIPMVGYSDDLALMSLLLSQLEHLVDPDIEFEVTTLMPLACS